MCKQDLLMILKEKLQEDLNMAVVNSDKNSIQFISEDGKAFELTLEQLKES